MNISLGILSWRGEHSLYNALESYRKENFFSLFDEVVLFLPEQRPEETMLAQNYPVKIIGHSENLGILGGFKALAQSLSSKNILLVENDCPLICSHQAAQDQIHFAYDLLQKQQADIVRLRSRSKPGQDWGVNRKYRAYYPSKDAGQWEHILKFFKRLLRPQKAQRLKALSLYENPQEAAEFSDIIRYNKNQDCYFVSSQNMPWTNQSIMVQRDFFLEKIIAFAEKAPTKRRVNGFKNLEIEMNSPYWRRSDFTIAIPQGIFTHHRVDDRGYIIEKNLI